MIASAICSPVYASNGGTLGDEQGAVAGVLAANGCPGAGRAGTHATPASAAAAAAAALAMPTAAGASPCRTMAVCATGVVTAASTSAHQYAAAPEAAQGAAASVYGAMPAVANGFASSPVGSLGSVISAGKVGAGGSNGTGLPVPVVAKASIVSADDKDLVVNAVAVPLDA